MEFQIENIFDLLVEDNVTEIVQYLPIKDIRVICIVSTSTQKLFQKHLLKKYKMLEQALSEYRLGYGIKAHAFYRVTSNDLLATIGVEEGLTICKKNNKKCFCTQDEYKIYINDERCCDHFIRSKCNGETNFNCLCGTNLKLASLNNMNSFRRHLVSTYHCHKVAEYNVTNHNDIMRYQRKLNDHNYSANQKLARAVSDIAYTNQPE